MNAIIFALDDHTVIRAIAVAVFYHHVYIDTCFFTIRTGDMELPCIYRVVFLIITFPHEAWLLYRLKDIFIAFSPMSSLNLF